MSSRNSHPFQTARSPPQFDGLTVRCETPSSFSLNCVQHSLQALQGMIRETPTGGRNYSFTLISAHSRAVSLLVSGQLRGARIILPLTRGIIELCLSEVADKLVLRTVSVTANKMLGCSACAVMKTTLFTDVCLLGVIF